MGLNALFELNDPRFRRTPSEATVALAGSQLRLGGFAVAKAGGFERERVAALLAAAYGETLPRTAVAYLKGAFDKQSEGQTALAQTYLALAGLPPLADSIEATWRLSAADGMMKAGIAPATIIEALAPKRGALECAYNPDQPRVPAGNGVISGQWTSEDRTDASASDAMGAPHGVQITDNSPNWVQYLNPVGTADAADANRPAYNGPAPNAQHQAGVANAISRYQSLGYQIFSDKATAVDIEGFDSPGVYDFVVRDPNTGNLIGVEVKTTLGDTIFLNPVQVGKDVTLMLEGGAIARTSGEPIRGVSYTTYCGYCDQVDIRPTALYIGLDLAKVPFIHQSFLPQ
jgi:hypothetical protein